MSTTQTENITSVGVETHTSTTTIAQPPQPNFPGAGVPLRGNDNAEGGYTLTPITELRAQLATSFSTNNSFRPMRNVFVDVENDNTDYRVWLRLPNVLDGGVLNQFISAVSNQTLSLELFTQVLAALDVEHLQALYGLLIHLTLFNENFNTNNINMILFSAMAFGTNDIMEIVRQLRPTLFRVLVESGMDPDIISRTTEVVNQAEQNLRETIDENNARALSSNIERRAIFQRIGLRTIVTSAVMLGAVVYQNYAGINQTTLLSLFSAGSGMLTAATRELDVSTVITNTVETNEIG